MNHMYQQYIVTLAFTCLLLSGCSATKEIRNNSPQQTPEQKVETIDNTSTDDVAIDAEGNEGVNIEESEERIAENGEQEAVEMEVTPEMLKVFLENMLQEVEEEAATTPNKPYQGAAKRTADLLHTKLELRLDWKKRHVLGKATLQLKPYFYSTNKVTLDAKGFDIKSVSLLQKEGQTKTLDYNYDNWELNVELDKEYAKDESYTLLIDYVAKPDELADKDSRITYDNKGLYFIDPDDKDPSKPTQVWTQGETESSSCWFPTIDNPNERTTQEVIITLDNKYVSLTNGKLLSTIQNADGTHTDHWKQELAHAPYLFALIVGEYAIIKDRWKDIEVNYYVEPAYENYAQAIFGNTPEMMTFFSDLLDYPYPWDKYSQVVVRDFTAGAMENTGTVTFFEEMQRNHRELQDETHEDIIAHELIHHWFGDLLTCESWANLTLNEAFATYGEYLWFEHKYGREAADYHLSNDLTYYLSEAENKKVPIVRFYHENPDDLFDRHTYNKGGRVLHSLRKYVGDEAFFDALRLYIKRHEFEAVEIHDLRQAFEHITGEDLNWFFDQWFLAGGHPELEISYGYDGELQRVNIFINQLQTGKAFILPTDIDIYHSDGTKERHRIVIKNKQETFSFDALDRPKLVNVDAEKALLGEKTEQKPLKDWVYQYKNAPLFLDRQEAILELENEQEHNELALQTLVAGLRDDFWIIRKTVIEYLELENEEIAHQVQETLMDMAQNDKKSLVRAIATSRLLEIAENEREVIPIFEKGINDKSYLVASLSLNSLYEIAPEKALKLVKSLENEQNISIVSIVAKIYSEKGNLEQQNYFENKLNSVGSNDRYTLIDYYGEFINRNGESTIDKGLPTLESIARKDKNWWVRLNATQTIDNIRKKYENKERELVNLADKNGELKKVKLRINNLTSILQDIKAQETDEKLLQFYQNM